MVKVRKPLFVFLIVMVVSLTFLSYLVFVNAEMIGENVGLATSTIAEKLSLAQIGFEERMKQVRGGLLSANVTPTVTFEKLVGSEKQKLSIELVESVTWQGTHLKVGSEDVYLPSGGTSYANGWLIRHRGNIEDMNGIVYSDISAFFVGFDSGCGPADHYECVNGSLHWLYCNGTDYGIVEGCDACGNNECIKKGTFARWNNVREFKKANSDPAPRSEGLPVMEKENNRFVAAISGISE